MHFATVWCHCQTQSKYTNSQRRERFIDRLADLRVDRLADLRVDRFADRLLDRIADPLTDPLRFRRAPPVDSAEDFVNPNHAGQLIAALSRAACFRFASLSLAW